MKNVECFDAICDFLDSFLAKEEKTDAHVAACIELVDMHMGHAHPFLQSLNCEVSAHFWTFPWLRM